MRKNPDNYIRGLERKYYSDNSFNVGIILLKEYLRTRAPSILVEELLSDLERQYQAPYTDLLAESILIRANFYIGKTSIDLCGDSSYCLYSKPLMWNIIRGYQDGIVQGWIDAISNSLFDKGLISNLPLCYDKYIIEESNEKYRTVSFDYQPTPHYATALFHNFFEKDDGTSYGGWFRVIWNNIVNVLPGEDYYGRLRKKKLMLMMEDEPGFDESKYYAGPKICIVHVPFGGQNHFGSTFTSRVELNRGVSTAIDVCVKLAQHIYFSKDYEEESKYSSTDIYRGPVDF